MQKNKRIARPEEKDRLIRAIRWCRANHMALAGLPFDDPLAGPGGIHLEIIAPEGTSPEHLEQALREGYHERDVVKHSVVVCPTSWFASAKTPEEV